MHDYDIAIVGAGAAGIAAARAARAPGSTVVVLEAGTRVGGRAWTVTLDGMALDLGCGWLHSADRNPLVTEAEAAGFVVDKAPSAWREQYREFGFSRADQAGAYRHWQAFTRRLADAPPASDRASDALDPNSRWNPHAEALSGFMNGAMLEELSIADFCAYERASTDANWRLADGYGAMLASRLPDVTLRLATPARTIRHDDDRVTIETPRGSIRAGAAIVTVSTAALAAGRIAFVPAIDDHLDAAAALPLGLADKLFLALDGDCGIPADRHLLGDPHRADTGSYYLRPFGNNVIEAFFGGRGARATEAEGLAAAFGRATDELAALLGSDIRKALRPLAASSWGRVDDIGGSYSHALPGRAGAREVLARPPSGRLFFAGEATHPTDFSTAHGAWESGLRAASAALAALDESAR